MNSIDIQEMSISALQEKMSAGMLTARDLAEAYLDRFEALNRKWPHLNAILELNPDSLIIAVALDAVRGGLQSRGRSLVPAGDNAGSGRIGRRFFPGCLILPNLLLLVAYPTLLPDPKTIF